MYYHFYHFLSLCEVCYLFSAEDDPELIFHLHGYNFYVVGYKNFGHPVKLEEVKAMVASGELFKRNLLSPVLKDTIRIQRNTSVALRFIADNPGKSHFKLFSINFRHVGMSFQFVQFLKFICCIVKRISRRIRKMKIIQCMIVIDFNSSNFRNFISK